MPNPKEPMKGGRFGSSPYLKYSGMAFQMAGTILVFALLGQWLDGQFTNGSGFTVVLTLIGVFGGLYVALKDFI